MADGDPLTVGRNNTANTTTRLTNEGTGYNYTLDVFTSTDVNSTSTALDAVAFGGGQAVRATGYGSSGIFGRAAARSDIINTSENGVFGQATRSGFSGVYGENTATFGYGVTGSSSYIGVSGNSTADGFGVWGYSEAGAGIYGGANNGIAVAGSSFLIGVRGVCVGTLSGTGVWGEARGGSTGIYGISDAGVGVQGFSPNGTGVYASGSTGLFATGVGQAANFFGNVFIDGNQTVTGTKSAAVPHPDGFRRQLYVLESPESWFEDFGEAMLEEGSADVDIDPEFAALIRADDYQVFLTPYGDCHGLYVSERRRSGFSVRELQNGSSKISFGYRVVARRKDVEIERLARVEVPELPESPARPVPPDLVTPERPIRPTPPTAAPDLPPQNSS